MVPKQQLIITGGYCGKIKCFKITTCHSRFPDRFSHEISGLCLTMDLFLFRTVSFCPWEEKSQLKFDKSAHEGLEKKRHTLYTNKRETKDAGIVTSFYLICC